MLFLGIDQHARQLTVSLRDQNGDVILARQVTAVYNECAIRSAGSTTTSPSAMTGF